MYINKKNVESNCFDSFWLRKKPSSYRNKPTSLVKNLFCGSEQYTGQVDYLGVIYNNTRLFSVYENKNRLAIPSLSSRCVKTHASKRDNSSYTDKDKVVSITYEEIGLFPRSFSRVLDRFLKQLFSDVDNLVIQEYRFYRYLFLTTIKTIFILFFVPFVVNFVAKNYIVKPITEYFWNTSHPEIFLSSYEQKRAFAELEKFEEKIYFEALVESYPGHGKVAINQVVSATEQERKLAVLTDERQFSMPKLPVSTDQKTTAIFPTKLNQKLDAPSFPLTDETPFQLAEQQRSVNSNFVSRGSTETSKQKLDVLEERQLFPSWQSQDVSTKLSSSVELLYGQQSSVSTDVRVNEKLQPGLEVQLPNLNTGVQLNTQSSIREILYPLDRGSSYIRKNKDIAKLYQEKTIELALYYNNHSIEAWTNFFADLLSLCTLLYLLITLEIQINITKSFLLEVFFGLDDSKKSLLILLVTDLLVGYHSSNLWELFFEFIFNHYGIPESQTGIFLLVATLPVLLDVLFKYLIFRHLNRSSPATVATYQAIIE